MCEKKGGTSEGKTEHYRFFSHRECEFFPCHEVGKEEEFNCLFCYCPLYTLRDRCGGNFCYTEDGIKDCSHCLVPHSKGAYDHIMSKCTELMELARK